MSVTNKVQGEGSRSRLFFTSTGFRIFEIRPSLQVVTFKFEAIIQFFLGFLLWGSDQKTWPTDPILMRTTSRAWPSPFHNLFCVVFKRNVLVWVFHLQMFGLSTIDGGCPHFPADFTMAALRPWWPVHNIRLSTVSQKAYFNFSRSTITVGPAIPTVYLTIVGLPIPT